MKRIFVVIFFATLVTACTSSNIAYQTQGEIIANQMEKADNDGTGKEIGQLSSLLVTDRDYRLSGWILGGLIGDSIENSTLGNVSELIIRLDSGRIINVKLDVYTEIFKEGDKVHVSVNKDGEPLDIQPM